MENTTTASVSVMAFRADGTPALGAPLSLNVVDSGQYSTNDIVAALGLAAGFSGSLTITSDTPVLVLNLTSTGNNGGVVVPVHPR